MLQLKRHSDTQCISGLGHRFIVSLSATFQLSIEVSEIRIYAELASLSSGHIIQTPWSQSPRV